MRETNLKIALAGLLHDMGKLAEGGMTLSAGYAENNQQLYQPSWDGRPSHRHALYTAAFIEEYDELLPSVCNQPGWGEGDSFINLAASHHKPETPMQRCITQADRLSSGLDRAAYKESKPVPFANFRSTRLVSILESLSPELEKQKKYETAEASQTMYDLAPLSAFNIFPVQQKKIDKAVAREHYQNLFDYFVAELSNLPHRNDSPSLWAEHFDSLFAVCGTQVPAARAGNVVPDVSLYDHCRTTAALAVPLYVYHQQTDTLHDKAIEDDSPEKLLLVSGDFYGIQDFIFAGGGEQQRLRAKLLRGRSFAVSLISELAAASLCEAAELPFTAVFLNAAGKFHLLAANTEETRRKIEEEAMALNRWLFNISLGQASLGVTVTATSPAWFSRGNFIELWDTHLGNMEQRKHQRLDLGQYGVIADFLESFNNEVERKLCPFCGRRPSSLVAEHDTWLDNQGSACKICRDHIMLGANLVKGRNMAIFAGREKAGKHESLLKPFFDQYQVSFHDEPPAADASLVKYWQLSINADGSLNPRGTLRLINGYVPLWREDDVKITAMHKVQAEEGGERSLADLAANQVPKTFNALAALAKPDGRGTEALGIIKADVDNLGLLMSCGMSDERFTISRMATLSRRLDQFFSLYLPYLLSSTPEFRDVYTVFAGGDDLFLIGPWNRMAPLALRLRQDWGRYVSGNDEEGQLTFSAGITLHKTHVPIDKLASGAEEALEQAKKRGRNRISMFGETVKWDKFEDLLKKRESMAAWVDNDYISRVMFYRFNTFVEMAGQAKALSAGGHRIDLADMQCLKWPALLSYSLERNISLKGVSRERAMREVVVIKNWLEEYGSALKIALWSQLYEQR